MICKILHINIFWNLLFIIHYGTSFKQKCVHKCIIVIHNSFIIHNLFLSWEEYVTYSLRFPFLKLFLFKVKVFFWGVFCWDFVVFVHGSANYLCPSRPKSTGVFKTYFVSPYFILCLAARCVPKYRCQHII